jgi:uncharacterized membrane protein
VAGDVLDLALLVNGPMSRERPMPRMRPMSSVHPMGRRRSDAGRRATIALASVAAVTAADVLAARRASGDSRPPVDAAARITVNRPVEEVYAYWRRLENLPSFMTHLRGVEPLGEDRSRWTASGPAGTEVSWEAEITADQRDERIAWRSVGDAGDISVPNEGSVEFRPAPGGRGTEVRARISYRPPAGRLGAVVAGLLGENPTQQLRDDLRRFKQILEIGQVVRSEGTPGGPDVRRLPTQRPAQPVTT